MTLTEFLLAQIAEDEWDARKAQESGLFCAPDDRGLFVALHITRHDPARVLAGCEAKRRIVHDCAERLHIAETDDSTEATWVAQFASETLWSLAYPYSDHPDFREEWRP